MCMFLLKCILSHLVELELSVQIVLYLYHLLIAAELLTF